MLGVWSPLAQGKTRSSKGIRPHFHLILLLWAIHA